MTNLAQPTVTAASDADVETPADGNPGDESRTLDTQRLENDKLASIGRLAAGIAHEINTPIQYVGDNLQALSDFLESLTTIIGQYRELIVLSKKGPLPSEAIVSIEAAENKLDVDYILEDAPKAIKEGLEGVTRVSEIVRAMKDFSHVDRAEASGVDLNKILTNALTVARNEYKYVADVETQFDAIPMVRCYAGQIGQVFLNIIINAAHAIEDTGQRGTITITSRGDGDHVEITIVDTGAGIPEQIRNKVFDPFFTTKEIGKGTGQGLNIAHRVITERHKGSLSFESEIGKGTRFIIRLPVETPEPAKDLEAQELAL